MSPATPSFETASALAATIDGLSNIALDSAALSPLLFMKTPEPKTADGYKHYTFSSDAFTLATPKAGIQNDKRYLTEELSQGMLAFPVLKMSASRNGRRIRKWKLRTRFSPKETAYSDADTSYRPTVKLAPRPTTSATKLPPKTPAVYMRSPNPPMIPRRKAAVQLLSPPDLKEASISSYQAGEHTDAVLKPRPTVLFLSPIKKRRVDDNVSLSLAV